MTDKYLESAQLAGLSAKASRLYVVLLEAGTPLSPKALILRSALHRQYVYDALEELGAFGLVVRLGERRSTKYSAASPDRLLQEAEKRRIDTREGVSNLMKLYDRSPAGVVDVVRGTDAAIESEFQMLRDATPGDFLDIIGGAGMSFVQLFEGRIGEWEEIRAEKNLQLRYLGSEEAVHHNRTESVIKNESRTLPGIGDIVNVCIRPDSVTFNIYEPEIVTVRVRNKEAVASQRSLFEILWKIAK